MSADPRITVYRATPEELAAPPRARKPALSSEDRELARVRALLYALRPDYVDAGAPLPPPTTAAAPVRVRDPMAGWGDLPRGLGAAGILGDALAGRLVAPLGALLALLDALPADARAVACWLRLHARLEPLRGLYVDVGLAFADAAQSARWARDLTARRDGAHHNGRTLVLATATECGISGGA